MPDHLAAIHTLLSQDDPESVRQGIALLQSLADPELWAPFATETELGQYLTIGEIYETQIAEEFHWDVAFWALRETGGLTDKTQLSLGSCCLLSDLHPLEGLSALETLDLSGCNGLASLDGIEHLSTLHALDLSACNPIDLAPLRQLPALTSLRLGNWETLTSLALLDGLDHLESLDLSGCTALTSLDGLAKLPALREVRLDGCDRLTSLAGLPATVRIARTPPTEEDAFVVRYGHRPLWMSETEVNRPQHLDPWDAWYNVNNLRICLNGLTTLSEREAKALTAPSGLLALDGLRTISDAVLTILAQQGGTLSLNGLTMLSRESAAHLVARHTGTLMLRGLATPADADEVLASHTGRVSLGDAFQYIDVGWFDASQDVERFSARVDATPLVIPVDGEATFTLLHQHCQPYEVKAGVLGDESVTELIEHEGSFDWWDFDSIADEYGISEPASTLVLPDGTEQDITLRHWPPSSTSRPGPCPRPACWYAFLLIGVRYDRCLYHQTLTGHC